MAETKTVNLNVETNLGSLKSQLKTAQKEVETLSEKFGSTSEAATNAAKKAAQLKDAIGDAKALTDAFNPDAKFNALTSSLSGVASGFSAYQGAMGLIGVDSKALEATLLKVQSAMALSQGLQGLGEAKDSFIQLKAVIGQTAIGQKALNVVQVIGTTVMKALNFVMKQNPIFLIIGGITALVAAIKIFNATSDDQAEKQKRINKLNEEYRKEIEKQLEIDIKLRDSRKGGLDDQERAIKLLKAKGGTDKEVYEAERKLIDTQLEKLAYASGYRGFLLKDEIKKRKDLQNDKAILDAQYNKSEEETTAKQKEENQKKIDANKARLNKIAEDKKAKELEDFKIEQDRLKNLKKLENDYLNEKEEAENDYYNSKLTAEQLEVQNTQDKYFSLIEQAKIYGQETAILEQAQKDELANINNKYREVETKAKADADEAQAKVDKEKTDAEKALQDKKIQMALTGLSILQDATTLFTAKNEKDARRQFKISKALSLSTAIINTGLAVTAALTAGGNPIKLATGLQFVEAGVAAATGGINIAKISATQFGGFGGGGADKPTKPSDSGGGGNVITPNFNIVGANGTNQLKQLQQAPIQAYVVSGEMSTQQSLDRNRLRNATL